MIRINLLEAGGDRPTPAAEGPRRPSNLLLGGLALLLALGGVAGHYAFLLWQAGRLDAALAREQADAVRLQRIQKQFQALQATGQALHQRIGLIGQLTASPLNPAPLLAAVDHSLSGAPALWLTQVEGKGDSLAIAGGAASLGRVADFLGALRSTGWFATVELRDSTEPDGGGSDGPYTFNLAAEVAPAPPAASAPPATAPATPPSAPAANAANKGRQP